MGALLGLGVLLAPVPARGTVLLRMSTDEMSDQATYVVQGKVLRQQLVEVEGQLWTDSYIGVSEVLKGRLLAGRELIVRQPGGEGLYWGEHVAGAAQFSVGEEVLVFARDLGRHAVLVGMAQGKYSVRRAAGRPAEARRDLGGAALVQFDPRGRMKLVDDAQRRSQDRLTLRALKARIRARSSSDGRAP
jgi:hypothetical protein